MLRSLKALGAVCVVLALAMAPMVAFGADEAKDASHGTAAAPASGGHAEAAHDAGGGLINLDKSLIIQLVNFLILLFVLSRLLYRPLLAKMEERTSARKSRASGLTPLRVPTSSAAARRVAAPSQGRLSSAIASGALSSAATSPSRSAPMRSVTFRSFASAKSALA